MKKSHLIGITLIAVFAFGAMAATSAFAEVGMEWLLHEEKLLSETVLGEIATEGELLLEEMEAPFVGKSVVHCSGVAEGTLGPEGLDLIEEVFGLKGEPVNDLTCEALEGCETSGTTPPLVEPVNLPWESELVLVGTTVRDNVRSAVAGKAPGYKVTCLVLKLSTTDECTGNISYLMENMPAESDVLALVDATTNNPPALCTASGKESGLQSEEDTLLIYSLTGLLLEIS